MKATPQDTPIHLHAKPGARFGHWTVLHFHGFAISGGRIRAFWFCHCDCGTKRPVREHRLHSGNSKSCGCVRGILHGEAFHNTTPEYRSWSHMLERCYNPNSHAYSRYGGRGITVCDRWRYNYPNFLADMGRRPSLKHSLDRIDNDKNYYLENCRWALPNIQNANRRPMPRLPSGRFAPKQK